MRRAAVYFLAVALAAASAMASDNVGIRQTDIFSDSTRPLHLTVWFPTETQSGTERVGGNKAFVGFDAIKNAAVVKYALPLVVLSHGYGGSWRNLSWLATALVRQGYMVAAVDHPGTTVFDRSPDKAAEISERPRDLSRAIDAVLADPTLGGNVDALRIAAIGHSLGGWTVMALAGGRFEPALFKADCATNASPRACALSEELGLYHPDAGRDVSDPRVAAFVSFDLGLARGFTPASLASITKPVLVIAAGIDIGGLPSEHESGYLRDNLPRSSSHYVRIGDAMHFSFMQLCNPGAEEMIEEENPGDGVVCKDGGTRGREAIHQQIIEEVAAFLRNAIPER